MASFFPTAPNIRNSSLELEKGDSDKGSTSHIEEFTASDLATFHEREDGRLIIDPAQARIEFGEEFTSRLKLTDDGTIMWPQPTDDPLDPQNWSGRKKDWHLVIIALATIVPDFDSAIGIASVFPLAIQYHTTTGRINNLTTNWSIFLLGPGGIMSMILMNRYGRLPVLFWTQLLALSFLVGVTFAPTLEVFTGLFIINDMYPFHLRARKLGIWTMAFVMSPHLSPFFFGFLVARASWRWAYGIGCMYGAVVVLLIAFGMQETMYDRRGIRKVMSTGVFRSRFESLVGITGWKTSSLGPTWKELVMRLLRLVWRPHFVGVYIFEAMSFGFANGVNLTNTIVLQSAPPFGFGLDQISVAGIYAAPVIAVFIGEILGRYFNDWNMYYCVRHNDGVFEAESRLRTCYISVPLFLIGFLVLGDALQIHHSVPVVIVGWTCIIISYLMTTTSVYAYCNDCFPRFQGEVSAILNEARILRGFGITFFQIPWSNKSGALQTLGVEAAIVCGLFLLVVPFLQYKGDVIRRRFAI